MDPAGVKALHDAFKKAIDGPKHLALLAPLNQGVRYLNSADCAKWARETCAKERRLLDRLGLSLRSACG